MMSTRRCGREDLIDAPHKLAERMGRTPTQRDTHKHADIPSNVTFVKRFGTWREVLEAAGIPLNPLNTGYEREALLEHLRSAAKTLGRTPPMRELREFEGPDPTTYAAHFGSWRAALGMPAGSGNCGPESPFSTWYCETVEPYGTFIPYRHGDYASITVSSAGLAAIAYYGRIAAGDGNLKVACQRLQVFLPLVVKHS
jgi:hypothetical protein